MPELPDVTIYLERLDALVRTRVLVDVRLISPFVLRTANPPLTVVAGKRVQSLGRLGKRLVLGLEEDLYLVIHLMIAGRLRWKNAGIGIPRRGGLAGFDFEHGSLVFTEASKKKRASLHLVQGRDALAEFDRGGLEVLDATGEAFSLAMRRDNHTLKRALTDPRVLSGIGNAYSDEILHRARLSPFKQTKNLPGDEMERLFLACREVLNEWILRLRSEVGDGFPDRVTAFREEMAVHGRYKHPCPVCGSAIQRIRYAQNEANYCARCQTEGRLLADRSLSRLLKKNWPKTIDELER